MTEKERESLYTVRWYVREKWTEPSAKEEVLELLNNLLDPGSAPIQRPSVSGTGQKLLWCPFAQANFAGARSRGAYAKGYPVGAIVHFTAGRRNGLASAFNWQVNQGYLYFVIDKDGNIGQNFSLDSWGHHAGQSSYPGLGTGVSDKVVGIEIECAGKLKKSNNKFLTWYDEEVPASQVRTIPAKTANQEPGAYQKYTSEQEEALLKLLVWLKTNNPDVFQFKYVLGHDEVSPGRKNDPGGCLSMTMPQLREKLKTLVP